MNRRIKIFFLLLCGTICLYAQDDIPEPMNPPRLVNDFAQTFNSVQLNDLEQTLRNYQDTTSTQIYVVTITDLNGYDISDFAARLGEKWHIGQKEKNNGVLILIKPHIANERGRVFIATGYGVEYILTDARVGRIIDQYMMPYLQNADYYAATNAAIDKIISYLAGEFQADEEEGVTGGSIIGSIIFILFILFLLYISSKGGRGGRGPMIGGGLGGFLGGVLGGGRSGGSWGGGGGFGGGGGGSFGGGGAGRGF